MDQRAVNQMLRSSAFSWVIGGLILFFAARLVLALVLTLRAVIPDWLLLAWTAAKYLTMMAALARTWFFFRHYPEAPQVSLRRRLWVALQFGVLGFLVFTFWLPWPYGTVTGVCVAVGAVFLEWYQGLTSRA